MNHLNMVDNIESLITKNNTRISWDEYFMSITLLASCRSSCDRLHVGCVIVDDEHRIISVGYNGYLANVRHKSRVRDGHEQSTVHAEQNAVAYAAKNGVSLNNTKAYISHYPCINCTKILIASGIKEILYHKDYKNDDICKDILNDAKIKINKI